MAMEGLLGRVLLDPATGLPNLPYFEVIHDWEAKRAERRNYNVRVLDIRVEGGAEVTRRTLGWRLRQLLRSSDLIASRGTECFRVLLTSPDAEYAESVASRVARMVQSINGRHPGEPPIGVQVAIDGVAAA